VFLRLHRLTEDGIAPAVLLLHRARRIVEIVEHLRLHRRNVRNHTFSLGVDLQHCATTRTREVEIVALLGHGEMINQISWIRDGARKLSH